MLRLSAVDAYYGDAQALFDLDMKVESGELVSIIGPNSAGKSTLLKAVLGLVETRKHGKDGGIFFNDRDLTAMPTEKIIAEGIAMVPEGASVFPDMTVYDNLYLGGYTKHRQIREKMSQVFAMFPHLEERASQKAGTLSGGERQMLCLGRALMQDPKLILLDEPSLGLQPSLVLQIFNNIVEIHEKGVAILLVEQNVNQTLAITERTYVLERGRIAREDRSSNLVDDPYIRRAYLAV